MCREKKKKKATLGAVLFRQILKKASDILLATLKPIPTLYRPVEYSTNCVPICKPCCFAIERSQQEKYTFPSFKYFSCIGR